MHTFSQVLDADVVELFDLLHDQLLLVDLDDHRGVPSISPGESELAEAAFSSCGMSTVWDCQIGDGERIMEVIAKQSSGWGHV